MRRFIALGTMFGIMAAACGGAAAPSPTASAASVAPTATVAATKAAPTKVNVASAPNIFLSALYVADAEGYFKAENIDLTITAVSSGVDSVAAMVSGSAQFADIGFEDLIGLSEKGEKSLVLAFNVLSRNTLTLVMRTDVAKRLGVSRSTPIEQRYAALKGLRLGITRPGAPTDNYMRFYLRQAGLNPDRDAQIVAIGGGAALLAALESNQIDAFQLSPPTPYLAADKGTGTIIIDGPAGDVPQFASMIYTAFATNRDWAAKNPAAASGFIRALRKAMTKVRADPAGVAPTVAKAVGSTDVALTERVLRTLLPAMSDTGCMSLATVNTTLDALYNGKLTAVRGDPADGVLWTGKYNSC